MRQPVEPNGPPTRAGVLGEDTVELHDSQGWPGIDDQFDAKIGGQFGPVSCSIGASAEIIVSFGSEYHWAFQFQRADPDGFTVESHDRDGGVGLSYGPASLDLDLNTSDNSIYVGDGIALDVGFSVDCHLGPIPVGFSLGKGLPVDAAYVNRTQRHVPMTGEGDLPVEATSCPSVGEKFGAFDVNIDVGVAVCEQMSFRPGTLQATLVGAGGSPQQVSMGYGTIEHVLAATAPKGGLITASNFSFSSNETTHFVAGVQFSIEIGKTKGHRHDEEQPFAHSYTSHQRRDNQVGPTTPEGYWKDGRDKQWRDQSGNAVSTPTEQQIAMGNANWIHTNQKKGQGTLADGRWLDNNGRWRSANGRFASTPTAEDLQTANPATTQGDHEDNDLDPPDVDDDLHGWTVDTTALSVAPALADPVTLQLDLPVLPPPDNQCLLPGGVEGGGDLPFPTKQLDCTSAIALVNAVLQTLQTHPLIKQEEPIAVDGYTCRILGPGVPQPGSTVLCTKGAVEVRFSLAG